PASPLPPCLLFLRCRAAFRRGITTFDLPGLQEGLAEHVLCLHSLALVRDRPFLLPRGQYRVGHRHDPAGHADDLTRPDRDARCHQLRAELDQIRVLIRQLDPERLRAKQAHHLDPGERHGLAPETGRVLHQVIGRDGDGPRRTEILFLDDDDSTLLTAHGQPGHEPADHEERDDHPDPRVPATGTAALGPTFSLSHGSSLDEFDDCYIRRITRPMSQLADPRVPPVPSGEPRPDLVEQLRQRLVIPDPPGDQAPGVEVSTLRLGDQRLRELPQLLRLRDRRLDPPVQEERGGHVPEHQLAVLRRPREVAPLLPVPHCSCSSSADSVTSASTAPDSCGSSTRYSSPSSPSSSFIPKWRLWSWRNCRISSSDFTPKLSMSSICSSVRCTRSASVMMFSFFREFTDRTESSARSSMDRRNRSRSGSGTRTAPGTGGAVPPASPNRSMYSRCLRASSAPYATASSGDTLPFVSTRIVSRSKSVRCPTRVSSTVKFARSTGL